MPPDPATYTFDAEERLFKDKFGRNVSRTRVRESLDAYIDSVTADIRADTQALVDGNLSIAAWHLRMESHIKRSHTAAAAIAKGGWKQATGGDWAMAGREIKEQYQYLWRFARQLEAGREVNGGTVARAEMYGLAATKVYEGILRRDDLLEDFDLERRLVHSQAPCERCIYYEALGWTTAGTLPNIGEQCQCLTRCRCTFERKRSATAQKRRRATKPKLPKPPPVPKPPVPKPPPVVIPTPTPKPPPVAKPPRMPTRKPVRPPEAPKEAKPPEQPPEPPKPVEATPEARIEAAREAQRRQNQEWADKYGTEEYRSLLKRFPDLVPPGIVKDRLGRYFIGDAKVKAIADLGPKYQEKQAKLQTERDSQNKKLESLVLKQTKLINEYVGSSRPIPDNVLVQVDKLQTEIDRTASARDAVVKSMDGLSLEKRNEAHRFLKVKEGADFKAVSPNQSDWQQRELSEPTGSLKRRVNEAVDWLKDHVSIGDRSSIEAIVGMKSGVRAHYSQTVDSRPIVAISESETVKTVIHEFGHAIDYKFSTGSEDSTVFRKSKEFLSYRVGDEQSVPMNSLAGGGYNDSEMGRKDKFDQFFDGNDGDNVTSAYYSGHANSVEVFTMGLQEMWDDPVKMATKDPEWAKFVMGIMDGSLR